MGKITKEMIAVVSKDANRMAERFELGNISKQISQAIKEQMKKG
ncbi:hypothetical protein AB1K91_05265 [Terribacillus sp. 179-K 1B1 HS]